MSLKLGFFSGTLSLATNLADHPVCYVWIRSTMVARNFAGRSRHFLITNCKPFCADWLAHLRFFRLS